MYDYNNKTALTAAIRERNATVGDFRDAIAQWKAHSARLELQLADAKEDVLLGKAKLASLEQVLCLELSAHQRLDPSSPLLDKKTRDDMRLRHITTALKEQGYKVDTETGTVQSRIR